MFPGTLPGASSRAWSMPESCGRSGQVFGNAFQTCHRPHERSCRGRRAFRVPSPPCQTTNCARSRGVRSFPSLVSCCGRTKPRWLLERHSVHDDVLQHSHLSTLFAYSDAIWAKYGKPISDRNHVLDPKTNQPPTVNLQRERLEPLIKRGLRFAVCNQSSRGYAAAIGMEMGLKQDAVYEEMKANLLPNARLVPAGIVAINRAQGRGFSLASVEHA